MLIISAQFKVHHGPDVKRTFKFSNIARKTDERLTFYLKMGHILGFHILATTARFKIHRTHP